MPRRSSRRLHGGGGRSAVAALLVVAAAAAAAAATIAVATATATSSTSSGGRGRRPRPAWIAPRPALPRSARPCPFPSSAAAWRSGGVLDPIDPPGRSSTALAAGQHRGSSGSQRGKRRRDGGGGGKSYKEREREKANKRDALPLPMPPGDEDEAGAEGNKPEHWPEKVLYGQKLKWPSSSSSSSGAVKEAFRRRLLPGIRVRYIDDPAHLLRGQYGVYATREFNPFDIVGEYVGRVVPPEKGGEYVATIDWEDRRFEDGAGEMWGVDSAEYGNEVRMINHYRGIGPVPNCKLVTTYVNELPHILAVVIRPIRIGQELLLDYGPNYFSLGAFNPAPPEPPGIDDPPEVILEGGQAEDDEEDEESDV